MGWPGWVGGWAAQQLVGSAVGSVGGWLGGQALYAVLSTRSVYSPLLALPVLAIQRPAPYALPPFRPALRPLCNLAGAIASTPQEKRRFAAESLAYNVRNPTFRKLFPEWVKKHEEAAAQQAQQAAAPPAQQQQQQQPDGPPAPGQQQQQQPQQQPGGAGAGAALAQQGQQPQQWSGYLVGAAAVAAAGVAATLLMKPADAP